MPRAPPYIYAGHGRVSLILCVAVVLLRSCISFSGYQGNCLAVYSLALLKCDEKDYDICANDHMMAWGECFFNTFLTFSD